MTKQTTRREGTPAAAPAVPWGENVPTPIAPEFAPPPMNETAVADAAAMFAQIDQSMQETSGIEVPLSNPFSPPPSTNPFKAKPIEKVEAEVEEYEVRADQPSWGEFVKFVMAHGDQIIQARYPRPMGTIETLWRGVQVFPHPEVELRHVTAGWVSWEVATGS